MARLTGVYAISTLGAACAIGDDHIRIIGGQGKRFPSAGDYMLRIGRGPTFEIVRATLRDEDIIYVTRAQDGTEAISHPPGTPVWCVISHTYVSEIWKQADDMTLALGILEGDIVEGLAVAPADSPDNALLRDAIGNKTDAAVTTPADTASLVAYTKGLLTILGVPARDIDTILGARWDSSGDLGTDIGNLITYLTKATKDEATNTHVRHVVGSKDDRAVYAPGTDKSLVAYLKGLLKSQVLATGTFTTSDAAAPGDTGRAEPNGRWDGCALMPVAGTCAWERRPIKRWDGLGKVFNLDVPLSGAPGLVAYAIVAADYPAQRLADILSYLGGLLVLTETGGTVTTTGDEQTLYIADAPTLFRPDTFAIDRTAMAAGDKASLRVYYRIKADGNYILHSKDDWQDDVSPDLFSVKLLPNRYGVKVTLQETDGSHRGYDWSAFYEA